jgi:hypothetical protein
MALALRCLRARAEPRRHRTSMTRFVIAMEPARSTGPEMNHVWRGASTSRSRVLRHDGPGELLADAVISLRKMSRSQASARQTKAHATREYSRVATCSSNGRSGPVESARYEYELFIVHAAADGPFVHGQLLPALGIAADRVLLSSELRLGAPIATEIERGVQSSRLTIAVLTPAYMADRWAVLGEQLASHACSVEGRLIPLLRTDCELPLRLDFLVALDFRNPDQWPAEVKRLRDRLGQAAPIAAAVESDLSCPYPGMRPYTASNAACFYGRDKEIAEIIGKLRAGEREIYIVGPSGSGKSSLVAAGVLPRLAHGVPGLGPFLTRSLRTGEYPAERLAQLLEGDIHKPSVALDALLSGHAPTTSLLLFIDQLEELFTLADSEERARFLASVLELRRDPRCVLVFTLRADFYGALMGSTLWTDEQSRISRIDILPLRGAALRAAIERPARDIGVYFEPELVERLLSDAASEPGILPLLQETLAQLWDRRRLKLVILSDYQALGDADRSGLAVPISRRAEATLCALTPTQRAIARRILLRLVSFGEGRADTRRQQPRAALHTVEDTAVDFETVLRRLTDARLLTIDGDPDHDDALVDLAHEVMISAWPTLAQWAQTWRIDEQHRRQIEAAAAAWVRHGRRVGGLLDGVELAEIKAWRQTEIARALGESADVTAFIAASEAALQAMKTSYRSRRRRSPPAATTYRRCSGCRTSSAISLRSSQRR